MLPGVVDAVRRGMRLEIVEPKAVRWRRAYAEATERHASQVRLGADGALLDYVAGLPFPDITVDDADAGTKVMWNHACGPWRGPHRGATGGVVADLNSSFGFNGPVGSHTWKLLGEREMLGVSTLDATP